MAQLREFARHKKEFDERKVRIVALYVDDLRHVRQVWEKVTARSFTILSDPGAKVHECDAAENSHSPVTPRDSGM